MTSLTDDDPPSPAKNLPSSPFSILMSSRTPVKEKFNCVPAPFRLSVSPPFALVSDRLFFNGYYEHPKREVLIQDK